MKLFAWFPQGGRLEVDVPAGYDASGYRDHVMRDGLQWITLADGSWANVRQILRLEVADEATV